jgi:hypothetical protein
MYEKKKDTGRYIMLDRIIKYLFALIGAFTGVSLVRFFVKSVDFEALGTVQIALYVLAVNMDPMDDWILVFSITWTTITGAVRTNLFMLPTGGTHCSATFCTKSRSSTTIKDQGWELHAEGANLAASIHFSINDGSGFLSSYCRTLFLNRTKVSKSIPAPPFNCRIFIILPLLRLYFNLGNPHKVHI